MAEVQAKDNGGKEKGKQKKMTIRVDFTPMVDMNMLLITFFMLCTSPIVMIKASDDASYKNLIDVLDEMQICNISKYAIVDMTEGDTFLLDNLASKGELTKNIDRSK